MSTKKIIYAIFNLIIFLPLGNLLLSQNINGKLGTGGEFIIRDTNNTFLTLSQSTGNISLFRNMELGGVLFSTSTSGVITKNGNRFIHNYQAPGTPGFNTFVGIESGNFSMNGTNTQASHNTAVGHNSLSVLTNGFQNTAIGYNSLGANTTGFNNTVIGTNAGITNTVGYNNIIIGYDAQMPTGQMGNGIRMGNINTTSAFIQVAWTVSSDRNWKSNILNSNLGLEFLNKLRPVSYTRKNDETGKTEYGLIAQEVEETLKQEGVENSGMLTVSDNGEYLLRYNDLIAPMIKAIQELKSEKDSEISKLKVENDELKKKIESLELVEERIVILEKYMNEQNNIKEVNSEINTVNQ